MPRREPRTLIELAAANVGILRAGKALGYLAAWCIARHKVGPEIDAESYREFWLTSRATAYRELALIRKAFPGVEPEKVYAFIVRDYRERKAELERKQSLKLGGELVSVPTRSVMS